MKKILSIISVGLIFSLPFSVFATTSTFSPSAGNNSPADGLVWSDAIQSWATARANSTGSFASATDNSKAFLAAYSNGSENEILRSMRCYDTSSLPDDAVVTDASETLYMYADSTWTYDYYSSGYHAFTGRTGSHDYFALVDYNGSTNTITTSDYDNFGSTKFSGDITFSSLTLGADNVIPLNTAGKAHINTTGLTCFGMRDGYDLDNSAYPSGTNFELWGNDAGSMTVDAGTPFVADKPPRLSVTYTSGTSTPTPTHTPTDCPDNTTLKADIQSKIDELQALVDEL